MDQNAKNWQMLPFVSYISLAAARVGQKRTTAETKKKAEKEAINRNVILILVNLYGKTS